MNSKGLTVSKVIGGVVAVAVVIGGWNYFSVTQPVSSRLAKDSRNSKVSLWAYHQYGLLPSVLVVDLRNVDDEASAMDVIRALFQGAEGLKDKKFERVVLAYKGAAKFVLEGEYFQKLGRDFEAQNPVYTIRTLPENVFKVDGTKAYGTWTGGWLGVMGKQMEDVNQFSQDWYLSDFANSPAK